jgi:hypothetical protein
MTLQIKFEAALAIIAEHNTAIGPEGPQINADQFITYVKAIGGTTEDRLKNLSYEDILECFPKPNDIKHLGVPKPRLLAKEIAKIFRGKEEVSTSSDHAEKPVSSKHAERMSLRELVEAFDPENSENAVGKQLGIISKGQEFIVYSSGRIADVESTLKLLGEIKQGFPGRTDYNVNGVPVQVYRIGDVPDNFADENPLWANRPLRPDGTCDQMGRSWEGVTLDTRQLIYIAVNLGEIELNINTAHDVLDMALESTAMSKLRLRYRKASLRFNELSKLGKLPTLKLTLGVPIQKNPLNDGKKVVWAAPVQRQNFYKASR